jgi:hypothetical protein
MHSQIFFVELAKQKAPDARLAKAKKGMRRTCEYVGVTRLERNATDGLFAKSSIFICIGRAFPLDTGGYRQMTGAKGERG